MEKYQSYKHSGLEWIGEIPENWTISKFKFLTTKEVQYGVNSSSENYVDTGIRFIRTTDILDSGELIDEGVYVEESTIPERQITELFDFLISRSGTLGRTYLHLNSEKYTYGGYLVRFNFGSEPISKFIDYYCKSTSFLSWITLNTIVSTIGNVNGQKYSNMEVPLPPSNSIIKIVQFLDSKTVLIDKLISTKERKITLLKEQSTSLINQVVTKGLNPNVKMKYSGVEWIGEIPEEWLKSKLKYKSKIIGRIGYRGYTIEDLVDEGQGVITLSPSNIVDGELILEKRTYLSYEKYYESPEIILEHNDIVYVQRGSTIGKSTIIPMDHPEMTINPQLVILKKFNCVPRFIYYFMKSEVIGVQTQNQISGGSTPLITQNSVENFIIVLPKTNHEQQQIVEFLDSKTKEIDDLVQLEQKKIDLLKEYRQSLISEVVTGKVKVTQ